MFCFSPSYLKSCCHFLKLARVVSKRILSLCPTMANSKFDYVKQFETQNTCLPNCWIVVRVDGKGFHRFTEQHKFEKPNDARALNLMTSAARNVMSEFRDIVLAYGQSDEYSFVFRKETNMYNRRSDKLMSYICSLFSSAYVFNWSQFFGDEKLLYPPAFDSRVVLYPTDTNLRDYLSWRQADTHINNLYNTCFWNLVLKKKMTPLQAQERLRGTYSSDKNELLFQEFGINYNKEPELFRKGTTLVRIKGGKIRTLEVDIIGNSFWNEYAEILTPVKKTMKDASTHMEPLGMSEIPEMILLHHHADHSNSHSQTMPSSDNHTQTARATENSMHTQTSAGSNNSTQTCTGNASQYSQTSAR